MERSFLSREGAQKRKQVKRRVVATTLISTAVISSLAIGVERYGMPDFFQGGKSIHTEEIGSECSAIAPQASKSLLDVSFDGKPFSGVQVESAKFAGLSLSARPDDSSWAQGGVLAGKTRNGTEVIRAQAERKTALNELLVMGTGGDLSEVSRIQVSHSGPQIGDSLCVINYEPTKDGKPRFPKSTEQGYNQPAVYGGFLVAMQDGRGIMLTLKDFGEESIGGISETNSRDGAAGGAILNKQGELVGIILPEYPEKTIDAIESEFDVRIKGMTDEQRAANYTLTVFQSVTPEMIHMADERFSLHERVKFSSEEGCNPESDLRNLEGVTAAGEKVPVNDKILQVIDKLANEFDPTVSCIISGHSLYRSDTGDVSDHSRGNALDIKFDVDNPSEAKKIVEWLYANREELGLKEVLSPWVMGNETDTIPFGTNDDHKNHIHVAVA